MRHPIALLLLTAGLSACTSLTPEGSRVKVYEADLATPEAARALPAGCRMLSTTAPVDQMESERHISDPYRAQRNDTASRNGNVLLVLSDRFMNLRKTDCSTFDKSPDCQSQSWYKVSFASYACDPDAMQTLARQADEAAASASTAGWWPFGKKKTPAEARPPASASTVPVSPPAAPAPAPVAPAAGAVATSELKGKVLVLMREGVGTDVIVAFVKSRGVAGPLSADEILDWKKSGIAEPVIEAAIAQSTPAR